MVSTGTNVELRKVSGMVMKNVEALAVSAFLTVTPTRADNHATPKQNTPTTKWHQQHGQEVSVESHAEEHGDGESPVDADEADQARRADAAAEDCGARHGEGSISVDETFLQIRGDSDAGVHDREEVVLDEDAGDQIVDVVEVSARADRSAEDVVEEEEEHHRSGDRRQQRLRVAAVVHEIAPRHHRGVGREPSEFVEDGADRLPDGCRRRYGLGSPLVCRVQVQS